MLNAQQSSLDESPVCHQEPVRARLKWFNGPKGFGFLVPEDKEVDAFVHITTLQNAGVRSLGEGACMLCNIEYGPRGAMVREVLDVIDVGVAPSPVPDASENADSDSNSIEMKGSVKWYMPDKGFGFIVPEDGKKDVFVHQTCLDKHGLNDLEQGTEVLMNIRNVPKGREVIDFEVIDQ